MKQNQMFSSRDTLEEAHEFATDIALSLDKGDQVPVLTAIHVLTNTAIELLEEKEKADADLSDPDLAIEQEPIDAVSTYTDAVACLKSTNSLAKLWGFSIVARGRADSRLREDFNVEGTTTGRTYGAYTEGSEAVLVNLRWQITRATHKLDDPSDLRFVLFVLDYILQEKPL